MIDIYITQRPSKITIKLYVLLCHKDDKFYSLEKSIYPCIVYFILIKIFQLTAYSEMLVVWITLRDCMVKYILMVVDDHTVGALFKNRARAAGRDYWSPAAPA